ncbi:MAG: lipoprotein [Ruminococcus sp.]|nr:lipoprotein [Ruminococcus sp.]
MKRGETMKKILSVISGIVLLTGCRSYRSRQA